MGPKICGAFGLSNEKSLIYCAFTAIGGGGKGIGGWFMRGDKHG
jgi:hypothetical protein